MSEQQQIDNRIPVNIITGFLGSGKTTLLNQWVNTEEFKDTLVLINEFGDVGLDHELVQSVDDTVVLLGSGCICCTLQGELVQSLATNFIKASEGAIPKFKRVLIETTGLADPAGVISTLNNDDFCLEQYRYDGTVTVLDGQFVREQLQKQYEAVKQIALADIILISKTDLIDADEIDAIAQVARSINSSAKIHPMIKGHITPKIMEEIGPYKEFSKQNNAQVKEWLDIKLPNAQGGNLSLASPLRPADASFEAAVAKPKIIAHTNIESFAITRTTPISSLTLLAAINLVQQQYGDSILRLKGIIDIEGRDKPVIIHGVQGQLYPVAELDEWPEGDHVSKLVFIVRATVLEQIKHIFTQALDNPDESTIDYYRQVIAAAEQAGDYEDEGVEEIVLTDNYKG
ncbi:GTP-binding protein [Anaerobiospirillum sp. NML120448]|uniref:CobW family GTP-binding protein n=1 Tax=Anaerobiospirillum sp. NML120448 TaxID=2932816 RepID=UPI001FF13925|nr:GTP-binding protein [Anaerobiospirillum sp. NML120448]MCK0514332.1 GTP-binding protein [Anaerobiospirillum sp. NML120448]